LNILHKAGRIAFGVHKMHLNFGGREFGIHVDLGVGIKKRRRIRMTRDFRNYYHVERYLLEEVGPRFRKSESLSASDFYLILIWKANAT
jgi:hypothetical protein